MPKKVKLAWITNDAARRATQKKRSKSLIKKVVELCVLCGIKACLIDYNSGTNPDVPLVWPSIEQAMCIVSKLKSLPPIEQGKKMLTQEAFLRRKAEQLEAKLNRLTRENDKKELLVVALEGLAGVGPGIQSLTLEQATTLACILEKKHEEIIEAMERLTKLGMATGMVETAPLPLPPPAPAHGGTSRGEPSASSKGKSPMQQDNW